MRREWRVYLREAGQGKSIYRTFMNLRIREMVQVRAVTLDLGGGRLPSYYRMLGFARVPDGVFVVDINPADRPHLIASLEEKLPFANSSVQQVFLFNVLEHIYYHQQLLVEVGRILAPGGSLTLYVPFLYLIHAHPDDYYRYTDSTLRRLLDDSGLVLVRQDVLAGFGAVTADLIRQRVPTAVLKRMLTLFALLTDAFLHRVMPNFNRKCVLGYFVVAQKRNDG